MKLRELIEILDAVPEHLKDHPVLVEEMPARRVSERLFVATHFNVFFLESTTQNIVGHELRARSLKKPAYLNEEE